MNVYRYTLLIYMLSVIVVLLIGGCAGSPATIQSPGDLNVVFQEAQQLYDRGQFQQAIELWEQIPPSHSLYVDAQLGIRSARQQIEQVKDQQTVASRTLARLDAYISQAEQLEQQGDLTGAVEQYEKARRLDPKNMFLHNKIESLYTLLNDELERHTRLGDVHLAQGEYEKSRAEWEQLLLLDPSNEKAKQRLADIEVLTATSDTVFVKRGRALLEKGLVNAAKAEFEKARRVNPTNDRTLTYLSKLENIPFTEYTIAKGDTLSSIAQRYTGKASDFRILADFNEIAANVPLKIGQSIRIPHILGFKEILAPKENDILLETVSFDEEPQTESRGIENSQISEDIEPLELTFQKGVTAFQEGRYREAVSLLEKVLLRDPENEEAYSYFVRATENVRRGISNRVEIFPSLSPEPSEQLDPTQSEVQILIQTGLAYREAGDLKNAIATFEQASQLAPEDPKVAEYLEETRDDLKKLITAHLNEGIKLFNQDALEEAILEWNKVLELDPSNRQAAEYKARAEAMIETLESQKK